ncbi:MAG TPA: hypothetical protein VE467_13035, partial [Chryseolinea sp.]|nr:hypothetical protein [Chryseolinea sp.]
MKFSACIATLQFREKTSLTPNIECDIKDTIFKHRSMKTLALIFVLFLNWQALAQERFSPGFYVNQSQDTVRGFVLNRIHYSTHIVFRTTLAGESQ